MLIYWKVLTVLSAMWYSGLPVGCVPECISHGSLRLWEGGSSLTILNISALHPTFQVLMLGAVSQVVSYALEAPAPPFPVFVLGYFVQGFGISLQVRTIR